MRKTERSIAAIFPLGASFILIPSVHIACRVFERRGDRFA